MTWEIREEKQSFIRLKRFNYKNVKEPKDPYIRIAVDKISTYYTEHDGVGKPTYTVVNTMDRFEHLVENTVEQIDRALGLDFDK